MHFFCFNDTPTTEISTLSLHDALPIFGELTAVAALLDPAEGQLRVAGRHAVDERHARLDVPDEPQPLPLVLAPQRSEEHTSELQSRQYLVCRLLLEKKKSISTLRHHVH